MTSKKKLNSVQGEIEAAGLGIQREKVVYPQLASVVEREREREREAVGTSVSRVLRLVEHTLMFYGSISFVYMYRK